MPLPTVKASNEYAEKLKAAQPTLLCLEAYKGAREIHKFKCTVCKNTWELTASAVVCSRYKDRPACKFCRADKRGYAQKPKRTHDEFMQIFKAHNMHLKFKVLSQFTGARESIKAKCLACGLIFYPKASGFMYGKSGCPHCNLQGKARFTGQAIVDKIKYMTTIKFEELPTDMKTPCKVSCKTCGNIWMAKPLNLDKKRKYACTVCAKLNTGYKRKEVKFNNKTYQLQGYEPLALPIIAKTHGKFIKHGKDVPRFIYDNTKRYYPDFYMPKHNTIVEVKSNYTLAGRKAWYLNLKKKRKAVVAAGYKFDLIVFNIKEKQIPLPVNWHLLKYDEIKPLLWLK
jgi:hypothetical protein